MLLNETVDQTTSVGGAIYITDFSQLYFNASTSTNAKKNKIFEYNSASYNGPVITAETSFIRLYNIVVRHHNGENSGLFFDRSISVQISNALIYNNSANKGGAILCQSSRNVTINNIEAYNNSAQYGGVLYLLAIENEIIIQSGLFYNNKATQSAGVIMASGIYSTMKIESTIFRNNTADEAAVIRMVETYDVVTIKNSYFIKNTAQTVGVLYSVLAAGLVMKDSQFTYNNATDSIGVMSLANQKSTNITNCTFFENFADQKGVFSIDTRSNITIQDSLFENNYGNTSMSIGTVTDSLNFLVYSSNFHYNEALLESNCISIMQTTNVVFDECEFEGNQAQKGNANIEVSYYSNIEISDCIFKANFDTSSTTKILQSTGKGFFLLIRSDTFAAITDTTFEGALAQFGGAIYIEDGSEVDIQNCKFIKNIASEYGGAIYSSSSKNVNISNSIFTYNTALKRGSNLYLSYVIMTQRVYLYNIQFKQKNSYNSVYLLRSRALIEKVGFFPIEGSQKLANLPTYGQALYCDECLNLIIRNTFFTNYMAQYGGALAIITQQSIREYYNAKLMGLEITNSRFINNIATHFGGAIYLDNPSVAQISGCTFSSNEANTARYYKNENDDGTGGGIYYTCELQTKGYYNCDLSIASSNFTNNSASIRGGAMFFQNIKPRIDTFTKYQNNRAGKYGQTFATQAHKIVFVPEDLLQDVISSAYVNQTVINMYSHTSPAVLRSFKSGAQIQTIYVAIIDLYGNLINTDSGSMLFVDVKRDTNQFTSFYSSTQYENSLSGTFYTAQKGIFYADSLVLVTTPNSSQVLKFVTNNIDFQLAYNNNTRDNNNQIEIIVSVRLCQPGEEISYKGECIECGANSYLLENPTKNSRCISCPSEFAVCLGGANIFPRSGFWRSSNLSDNFIQCRNLQACLGGIIKSFGLEETLYYPTGKCDVGYQGILCADCEVFYQRQSSFKCAGCPDKVWNILRLVAIFMFVIVVIVILVRSTISGAKNKGNYTSAFNKILINHMQLISLIGSFDLQWPEAVKKVLQDSQIMQESQSMLVSFDCFLDLRTPDNPNANLIRIYFLKVLIFTIIPLVMIVAAASFFGILHLKDKKAYDMQWVLRRRKSTIIILLFFLYPTICQYTFSLYNCTEIDEDSRLYDDPEVICYHTIHQYFAFFVGFPSLFVWVIGIPLFGYVNLRRNKNQLSAIEVKETIGFLYNGFREPTYYWEIYIMYRKVLIVGVQVFLVTFGLKIQAYIILLLLMIFLQINLRNRPYQLHALNMLENASLAACLITTYCGLFYLTASDKSLENFFNARKDFYLDDGSIYVLFSVILIVNIAFIFFWLYSFCKEINKQLRIKYEWLYKRLFVCFGKEVAKFEREKILLVKSIQNEATVVELESLIDDLQKVKTIYAGGRSLAKDQKFQYQFRKFYKDLKADIDINSIQSTRDQRLTLFFKNNENSIKAKREKSKSSKIRHKRKLSSIDIRHVEEEDLFSEKRTKLKRISNERRKGELMINPRKQRQLMHSYTQKSNMPRNRVTKYYNYGSSSGLHQVETNSTLKVMPLSMVDSMLSKSKTNQSPSPFMVSSDSQDRFIFDNNHSHTNNINTVNNQEQTIYWNEDDDNSIYSKSQAMMRTGYDQNNTEEMEDEFETQIKASNLDIIEEQQTISGRLVFKDHQEKDQSTPFSVEKTISKMTTLTKKSDSQGLLKKNKNTRKENEKDFKDNLHMSVVDIQDQEEYKEEPATFFSFLKDSKSQQPQSKQLEQELIYNSKQQQHDLENGGVKESNGADETELSDTNTLGKMLNDTLQYQKTPDFSALTIVNQQVLQNNKQSSIKRISFNEDNPVQFIEQTENLSIYADRSMSTDKLMFDIDHYLEEDLTEKQQLDMILDTRMQKDKKQFIKKNLDSQLQFTKKKDSIQELQPSDQVDKPQGRIKSVMKMAKSFFSNGNKKELSQGHPQQQEQNNNDKDNSEQKTPITKYESPKELNNSQVYSRSKSILSQSQQSQQKIGLASRSKKSFKKDR